MIRELSIGSTWDAQQVAGKVAKVRLDSARGGLRVRVDSPFHGDPPPPGPPGSTPGLWNHEVVELFVAEAEPSGPVHYLEVELSPHGHHLVLRLRGVREVVEQGLDLDYQSHIDTASQRWVGEAILPVGWLPRAPHRMNAFAIHGTGRSRRYLAWSPLPGPTPDFHQPYRYPRVELPLDQPSS